MAQVSTNGTTFTTLRTWTLADSDNIYKFYEFDLTSYLPATTLYIRLDANMNATADFFYIDDITIIGN